MRYSGLRIGDATMLAIDKLKDNRLSLRTQKANKDISVLLPESVVKALDSFKPVSKNYFFWDGQLSLKSLTNLYRDFYLVPVFKAAQLKKAHPHQFRHTFAVKLLTHGTSVENVAALLGNSPKIVWKHYAAWVKERQEALDQAVLAANGYHHAGQAPYNFCTKCCCLAENMQKANKTLGSVVWRRGWDSNPRDPFGPNGFQDRRSQPLSYPSPVNSSIGQGNRWQRSRTHFENERPIRLGWSDLAHHPVTFDTSVW